MAAFQHRHVSRSALRAEFGPPPAKLASKPLNQDSLLRAIGEILLVRNQREDDPAQVEQAEASAGMVDSFVRDLRQFSDRLDAQTIRQYERRAYSEFYRNPRLILRHLRSLESSQELWRKTKAFITMQRL